VTNNPASMTQYPPRPQSQQNRQQTRQPTRQPNRQPNRQPDRPPPFQPLDDQQANLLMQAVMQGAYNFLNRDVEPKEYRLVDFPEFRGGNQDPIEWLEAFERACETNRIQENRRIVLVASYLKGTALT